MAKTEDSSIIGKNIRKRRKQLEMSQRQLGEALGLKQPTIAQYELGNRELNANDLARLARILSVPVSYFYAPETAVKVFSVGPPGETVEVAVPPSKMDSPEYEDLVLGYWRRLPNSMKKVALAMLASLLDEQAR